MEAFFTAYESLKSSFEEKFEQVINNTSLGKAPKHFQDAVHFSLFASGKRIRATLVLEMSLIHSLEHQKAMLLAGALECLHTYSLVHDDLPSMDDDDFRRGKPSSHKRYDEVTAILVGDCLQALSFELLADSLCPPAGIHSFAQAIGGAGMVGGQFMDIKRNKQKINIETLNKINFLKTGKLFQVSMSLPLHFIHTKASEKNWIQPYENWGKQLGLLFQIMDDLEESVDKNTGDDFVHDRSLNILDFTSSKEAWKIAEQLKKNLSKKADQLFPESVFLKNIPKFVFTRVK